MSRKLKYISTFSCLFLVGFLSSWMISSYEREITRESSIIESTRLSSTAPFEKHLMPLVITVQGPETYPRNPSTRVKLTATIRTPFPEFADINYKWILPDEVEVVKGQLIGDIQNPVANQAYDLEIQVKGFSGEERKEISLVATTTDPSGNRLGNSAVVTSRPEDSMEHIAPTMMLKAQEFKASKLLERMPASEDAK